MPKIIDHDSKKLEIGNVILTYIAQHGVSDLTIRKLSKFGGFSTGVLSHYFADKQEMLNWACDIHIQQIESRIVQKIQQRPSALEQIEGVIQELLTVQDESLDMIIPLYFWTAILHEDTFRKYLLQSYQLLRDFLTDAFDLGIQQKSIRVDVEIDYEIDRILALTDGFLIAWNVDKERFDFDYKLKVLNQVVDEVKHRIASH